MKELESKLERLWGSMGAHGVDGVLVRRTPNVAWLTCGATAYVNTTAENSSAQLLITPKARTLLCNNIEETRFRAEEQLTQLGFEFRVAPWHEINPALVELTAGLHLGSDLPYPGAVDISDTMKQMRINLLPEEHERYRKVGRFAAEAMDAAIHRVEPGMTEHQIAGLVGGEAIARGLVPSVNLVATDERIFRFRHPLPTDKRLEKYAELVLCGRRYGLVASITRLIHFGPLPEEIAAKQAACATVDATLISHTRPGHKLSEVLADGIAAYAATGYPDQWQLHHQGGPTGYDSREYIANPRLGQLITEGEAFAWNPTISGFKLEDTFLVGAKENELLTNIPGWPTVTVEVGGVKWQRPAVMVV